MLSRSHQPPEIVVAPGPPARPVRAPVRGPIRLSASRRAAVYVVFAATWLTGGLWLLFHYFLTSQGEFGPEPHPLEPSWLRLHGAAAFAALWTLGLLWGVHIVNAWQARRRRWSGGALFGVGAVLIVTGWLLYYAGDDGLRSVASIAHWGLGLAAPALFLFHRFLARDGAGAKPAASRGRTPTGDN